MSVAIAATAPGGLAMLPAMKRPTRTRSEKLQQAPRLALPAALADRYGSALQHLDDLFNQALTQLGSLKVAQKEYLSLQAAVVQACEDARSKRWTKVLKEAVEKREQAQKQAIVASKQARELAAFIRRHGQLASAAIAAGVSVAGFATIAAKWQADGVKEIVDQPLSRLLDGIANYLGTSGKPLVWDPGVNLGRVAIPARIVGTPGPRLKEPALLAVELEMLFRRFTSTGQAVAAWAYSPFPRGGDPHWPIVAAFMQAAIGKDHSPDACRKLAEDFRRATRDPRGGATWSTKL